MQWDQTGRLELASAERPKFASHLSFNINMSIDLSEVIKGRSKGPDLKGISRTLNNSSLL